MDDWNSKLDLFLADFEYADDVVGVLVCGSYITGNPTSHSDFYASPQTDFRLPEVWA